MPNGIMVGDGSAGDPFIVMDGYDFNALRNITTATNDIKYVEIGADISLNMYPSFTPIPLKHFNINGNNHLISNVSISGGRGLFNDFHTTATKDIRIEGELINNAVSGGAGLFYGFLLLIQSDSKISNIQCFGSITGRFPNSTSYAGGCFGEVGCSGSNGTTGYIEDCAFYGAITGVTGRTNTTNTDAANGIGGVIGFVNTYSYTGHIVISRCIAVTTFHVGSTAAIFYVGGIVSTFRERYSSSNLNTVTIQKCAVNMKVRFINNEVTAQFCYISGILGQTVNSTGSFINSCCSQMDILLDNPSVPPNQLCIAGMVGRAGGANCNVVSSYAVISMQKQINAVLTGLSVRLNTQNNVNSFYDATVLNSWFSGTPGNVECGRTTDQLKSQSYLMSQGWVFDV